jgi:DNA-binding GntR family transcriptional regulator
VVDILKEAIFTGKFRPGQTLAEIRLAKSLNVSQATVREALGQLEKFGLVIRIPNRSAEVPNLTVQEVRDRIRIRLALEQMAAEEAAARMSDSDLDELTAYASEIEAGIERNEYFEVSQADLRFHRFIWEKSGSTVLWATLDQIATPLFAFLGLVHRMQSFDQRTAKPHARLIEAFRSRDSQTVKQAVREHIEGSYGRFLNAPPEELHQLALRPEPPELVSAAASD